MRPITTAALRFSLDTPWADLSERELRRNVTSRTRTVIDCARAYDFDVALCVADSAMREGIIDRDDLLRQTLHPVGVEFQIEGKTLILSEKAGR